MKDIAILNSDASYHFLKSNTTTHSTKLAAFGPVVNLPDGDTMQATHTTSLKISELSRQRKQAYFFPKLKTANLLSRG